jgi:hypothetical protein
MGETRLRDESGQLVTIDDRLAFRWRGHDPLDIGEQVWLPGTPSTSWHPWRGTVTALGTRFGGRINNVTARA